MTLKNKFKSKYPQATLAGFLVLVHKRLFKDFRKVIAGVLVFTFSYTQLLFAANPRELLAQAKAGFEEEASPRLGGSSPEQLIQTQSQQQSLVDQQNSLQDLQNLNFSLTTQNGDILKYVNNTLKEVKTHDGNTLENVELDSQGLIQSAQLHLLDGSVQLLQDGKVTQYTTPNGTKLELDPATGRINKATSSNGLVSYYTYSLDNTGKVLTTTISTDTTSFVYNANNHLLSAMETNKAYYQFEEGILKLALIYNQGFYVYKTTQEGELTKASLQESSGCEVPDANTDTLPQEIVYNADKSIKEVTLKDATHFIFENGLLKAIQDKDKQATTFDFTQSLFGNLIQTTITQNSLNTTYDQQGNLKSIKLENITLFYKQDSSLDYIQQQDGTTIEDIVFDPAGNIQDATVYSPSGEIRIYQNGLLKEVKHQDTQIFYDLGKPLKLVQNDLTYEFNYTPSKITASLQPAASSLQNDTITQYEYDSDFNLKKAILQNNQIIEYLQDSDYAYSLTQDSTQSFYDKQNQIQKTLINPTTGSLDTLEVVYKYGKIREIYKLAASSLQPAEKRLVFKYSYSFDPDGTEKTLIEDLEEHTTKTYKNELLLTSLDSETRVLSDYSYDEQNKVKEVSVTRLGRELHHYTYSYQDNNTLVTDEEGTIRTYNQDNKLIFLEKDNQKWGYSYSSNNARDLEIINQSATSAPADSSSGPLSVGEEIVTETLLKKKLDDNSTAFYENGYLSAIRSIDGSFINDVTLPSADGLSQFTLHLPDGTRRMYSSSGSILEENLPDGTSLFYKDNLLSKVKDSQGQEHFYSYEKDSQGLPIAIWVETNNLKLKYNAQGTLLGLKLQGVLTPDEITQSTIHSTSGGGNEAFSYDRDFQTAQVVSQGQEGVGSINISLASEHTFQAPQTLSQVQFAFSGNGNSNGNTNNGSDIWGYVQVKDATTNEWSQVPGSYLQHNQNADGSGTNVNLTSGILTIPLNLSNIIAIKGFVGGSAYANKKGKGSGSTFISAALYEVAWTLEDQSLLSFDPDNNEFKNALGTIHLDSANLTYSSFENTAIQNAVFAINQNTLEKSLTHSINANTNGLGGYLALLSNSTDNITTAQEYSSSGVLETKISADGTVTLFNDQNKPDKVLDAQGKILIEYSYDSEGNPSKVYLKNARDVLPEQIHSAQVSIEESRNQQLEELLIQKQIAYETIKDRSTTQKDLLKAQEELVRTQQAYIESFQAKGKSARSQKAQALGQIEGAMTQVTDALSNIYKQESEAYSQLDSEVKNLSDRIEQDAQSAFRELSQQEEALKHEILRQEISPIVYDYYRRILGRDPSSTEYESWVNKIDYSTGELIVGEELSYNLHPGSSIAIGPEGGYITTTSSQDWNFGTGDFSIDFWVNFKQIRSEVCLVVTDPTTGFEIVYDEGRLKVFLNSPYSPDIDYSWNVPLDSWHHVAIIRDNSTLKAFINGNLVSSVFNQDMVNSSTDLGIGGNSEGNYRLIGNLDELRISKGIARWTQNFTPSTERYITDSYTKLLLRADEESIQDQSNPLRNIVSHGQVQVDTSLYKTDYKVAVHTPITANFIQTLKNTLLDSQELKDRQAYVKAIQSNVQSSLELYLRTPENQKSAFAQAFNLQQTDLINLTSSDAQKILEWLNTRSLHFGQSAFISLENLLDQKNISYDRVELATKAIVIDILTGIISPLDDGDLVISMFALNKVASRYGLELSGANVSWEDLQSFYDRSSATSATADAPKIVAHINGNHYIILTAISNDTITYIDPGAGEDKHNQVETISKKDFLKAWGGNITLESSQLAASSLQQKTLSTEKTQKIRGAFFFFFIPAILGALSSIGSAIAGVLASIGGLISSIGGFVANIVGSIGQAIGGLLQGIGYIGQSIWEGIHFAASSLFGAFGNPGTLLSQASFGSITQASFGQSFLQNIVQRGLSFVVSKGLDALGVSPNILRYISSFTGGNPLNVLSSPFNQSLFQTFVPNLALQGTHGLLDSLGVSSNITQALGLASGNFIDGVLHGTLSNQLLNIGQNLLKSASLFGLDSLSQSLGLNSSLVQSLGSGIFNNIFSGQGIIDSVNQSIQGGTSSYTVNFEGNSDPIFGSLFSPDILGSIGASIFADQGLFQNVFNIIGGSISGLVKGIQNFGSLIQQKGLFGALDSMVGSLFGRNVQETVVNQGGVANLFGNSKVALLPNGQTAREVQIDDSNAFYFDNETKLIGILNDDTYQIGEFSYDDQGSISFWDGSLYSTMDGGYNIESTFHDGQATHIYIQGPDNEPLIEINPEQPGQYIHFEAPKQSSQYYGVLDGIVDLLNIPHLFYIENGQLKKIEKAIQSTASTISNASQKLMYFLANGIANLNKNTYISPKYVYNLEGDLINQSQNQNPISDSDIIPIPLYNSVVPWPALDQTIDILNWLVESHTAVAGLPWLSEKIRTDLANHFLTHPEEYNRPVVGMGYSGGFMPLVEAITKGGYNVVSLVALGAATFSFNQDLVGALLKIIDSIGSSLIDKLQGSPENLDEYYDSMSFQMHLIGLAKETFRGFVDESQNLATNLINRLTEWFTQTFQVVPSNLPSLAGTDVQQIINVWGTKDVLFGANIAGKRIDLCGKPTTNIEIVGATHFDYMRREGDLNNPEDEWNRTVADFVTELIRFGDSKDNFEKFTTLHKDEMRFDNVRGVWIVKLNGWIDHQ